MRGQLELPALGIALLVLTAAVVVGVSVADSALHTAERPTLEQQTAVSLSERLVSEESPVTRRQNVLNASAVRTLSPSDLRADGLPAGAEARVRLDDSALVSTGTVNTGTTVERIVLVEDRSKKTIAPAFDRTSSVTLPRRTANATVRIQPANATVQRVRANDRVLLENQSGLDGVFEVSLSRLETTTLQFEAVGPLEDSDVRIAYYPAETRKATLEVTVDA